MYSLFGPILLHPVTAEDGELPEGLGKEIRQQQSLPRGQFGRAEKLSEGDTRRIQQESLSGRPIRIE